MKTSASIEKIAPAFLKAQKLIENATKSSENPYFKSKYADLSSVMEACKGHLNENNIAVLQPINGDLLETVLLHESGEWLSGEVMITTSKQNDPQALGSAITYARRYGLMAMIFMSAEDDDGESAMSRKKEVLTVKADVEPRVEKKLASEAQIKLINTLVTQKSANRDKLHEVFGVKSFKDLTPENASKMINYLQGINATNK